jgi:hypothetical protein
LTEACKAVIDYCYKDGKPVSIRPIINDKVTINGLTFKFTEELLEELSASGKVKVGTIIRGAVRITGI